MDHLEAVAAAEVGDRVADRVALEVADVGLARGVGQHLEHVGLRLESSKPGWPGLATSQVFSSAQTCCHLLSIAFGS